MTRQWTVEELNRVHPLPAGWSWADDDSVGWHARHPGGYTVCIDDRDYVLALWMGTTIVSPPRAVALAVTLASQGLDSREAMATAIEALGTEWSPCAGSEVAVGWAEILRGQIRKAAEMLRRGTVQP